MTVRFLVIAAAMLVSVTAISTTASVGPIGSPIAMGAQGGVVA
ncbi:hypothetical protein [Sphingomicrobium flavum]|nr:hypothetical protein [Sphingomicrobium flavum]